MKVQFGEWTLNTETRQLHHGAAELHVSTKAFDLLRLLIEARPRVLSKTELQDALWPGVFVSETNLFTVVAEVRRAIEDDARQSRFVRTVHGVGYAFSGEATDVSGAARATPACVLVWENQHFPLPEGEHVIGRDLDIAVTLDSSTVSRRHARLRVRPDATTIEDLDSKNGTFVNDARVVGETAVADGDRIRIGSLLTTLRRARPVTSTETLKGDNDRGRSG